MRRAVGLVVALAALLGIFAVGYRWAFGRSTSGRKARSFVAGSPADAPDFRVETTSGTRFVLSAARGHVVVMEFLSAGCQSCQPQVQALKAVDATLGGQGVKVLLIDETGLGDREILDYYRGELGGGPHLYAADAQGEIARAYHVQALGTTFIIDPRGRIAYKDIDPPASTLVSVAQRLLREA